MLTIKLETETPAFVRNGGAEAADILRHIAEQIECGLVREKALADSDGTVIGEWSVELPPATPPLVGEELVSAYITFIDTMWVNPTARYRMVEAYARVLPQLPDITDDATERAATIEDTDRVHPSEWVMQEDFVAHLRRQGLYTEEVAREFAVPGSLGA